MTDEKSKPTDAFKADASKADQTLKSRLKRPPTDKAFLEQWRGFSLTTAEILYRMPDHPSLLQTFIWQDYDLSPLFPKLRGFLDFWTQKLDGPLQGVRVAHAGLIKPAELVYVGGELRVH